MIGNQFQEIMREKIKELPMEKIGEVFIEKVLDDTTRGVDPTGASYADYAPSTAKRKGRSSPVTLRDRSRSIETLYQQAQKGSTRLGFAGSAGYGGSSKPAAEVFYMHQKGTARGGNVRKVFPEPEDITSSGMQVAIENVQKVLAEHFNG